MSVEARARITNPTGLHARPAVKLAQLAARFKADVRLRIDDGDWVPAKSTAKILKLKARVNAILQFRAEGEDAPQALSELVAFVERDFDDRQESAPLPASVAAVPAARRNALDFTGATASVGVGFGPLYRLPSPMSAVRPPSARRGEARLRRRHRRDPRATASAPAGGGKLETDIIAFQIGPGRRRIPRADTRRYCRRRHRR
ncbi:MAG: HPr family phosphocarrier protein [Gammaproteobacteria bacterium]